jgi:hypothetical protein
MLCGGLWLKGSGFARDPITPKKEKKIATKRNDKN